jgi:hypothetical protein
MIDSAAMKGGSCAWPRTFPRGFCLSALAGRADASTARPEPVTALGPARKKGGDLE